MSLSLYVPWVVRGGYSFCWYWVNCWRTLIKLSCHQVELVMVIAVFPIFRLFFVWFCLFVDLWVLTFPLEDCSVFGNFVITLIVKPSWKIVETGIIDTAIYDTWPLNLQACYRHLKSVDVKLVVIGTQTSPLSGMTRWFLHVSKIPILKYI